MCVHAYIFICISFEIGKEDYTFITDYICLIRYVINNCLKIKQKY